MKKGINFNWEYLPKFEEKYLSSFPSSEATIINIPHNVNDLPYNYFNEKVYQHLSTYRKTFILEKLDENHTVYLRFEAFMMKAKIYLNKVYLGEYVSSYSPIEINIEDYYLEGENELLDIINLAIEKI